MKQVLFSLNQFSIPNANRSRVYASFSCSLIASNVSASNELFFVFAAASCVNSKYLVEKCSTS